MKQKIKKAYAPEFKKEGEAVILLNQSKNKPGEVGKINSQTRHQNRFIKASKKKYNDLLSSHDEGTSRQLLRRWQKHHKIKFYKTAQEDNYFEVEETVYPTTDEDLLGNKGGYIGEPYEITESIKENNKIYYRINNGVKSGTFAEEDLTDSKPEYEDGDYVEYYGNQAQIVTLVRFDDSRDTWVYEIEHANEADGTDSVVESDLSEGDEGEFTDERAGTVTLYVAVTSEEYGDPNPFDSKILDEQDDEVMKTYFGSEVPFDIYRFDEVPRHYAEEATYDLGNIFNVYLNKDYGTLIHQADWVDIFGDPEIQDGDYFVYDQNVWRVTDVYAGSEGWMVLGEDYAGFNKLGGGEGILQDYTNKIEEYEIDHQVGDEVFVLSDEYGLSSQWVEVVNIVGYDAEYGILYEVANENNQGENVFQKDLTDDLEEVERFLTHTFDLDPASELAKDEDFGDEDILLASKKEADLLPEERESAVQSIQNTLEQMQQIFRLKGFRDDTWQNLIDGVFEKMNLRGATLPSEIGEAGDTRAGAEWYVDKLLSEDYEEVEEGDKTQIEIFIADWESNIAPFMIEYAENVSDEAINHLAEESKKIADLVEIFGEDNISYVVDPYLSNYLSPQKNKTQINYSQLTPQDTAIITMAYYTTGVLDPYDFEIWKSSVSNEIGQLLMEV